MEIQPDYASDNRLRKCRQIVKEIRPTPVNCPFGRPAIYRYACGMAKTSDGTIRNKNADEIINHPFRRAARHLRTQVERALSLSIYWPKEIENWLIKFVLPLEFQFEFGNHTPELRDKMLALDVSAVATKLFHKKRPLRLTIDTRRVRLIPRNARNKR
jgi:hypothetical protein